MEVRHVYMNVLSLVLLLYIKKLDNLFHLSTDASTYAHYLFNAFDTGHSGSIKFEVSYIHTIYVSEQIPCRLHP